MNEIDTYKDSSIVGLETQKTCFVIMGFGKKKDHRTSRILDLDKTYKNIIRPAVEAAGLKCIRSDDIIRSGIIDSYMYQLLLDADIVVADLSTLNENALYELGIRHTLRRFSTVVIAESGIDTFPFDINHIFIKQYQHLGDHLDYDEVIRFREELSKTISDVIRKEPPELDSPVYTYLTNLEPPYKKRTEKEQVAADRNNFPETLLFENEKGSLYEAIELAIDNKDFESALKLITEIQKNNSNDAVKQ
jgi:hypothetical protein